MDKKVSNLKAEEINTQEELTSSHYTLRSNITQEIISRQPGFLENWSLPIFLGILILIVGATWFVDYPDTLNSKAILAAENAPKELIVNQEGRLIKLFYPNSQNVKKGDIIGWIESNADHKEVLNLAKLLDSSLILLSTNKSDQVLQVLNEGLNNLGELQEKFQQFIVAKQMFSDYTKNGFYLRKLSMLEDDVQSLGKLNKNLVTQRRLTEQDLGLSKETFDINKILLDKKVITEGEYRSEKSKYVNKEMTIPQLEASLNTNDMQTRDKIKEIDQLTHDIAQQRIIFQQEIQSLRSKVNEWSKKYVIRAPISGKVYYTMSVQEDKYIRSGTLLGYINPNESQYYAETILPQANFGKIDTGMKVQLRFDAYPYEEWGYIEGKLSYVSNIPSDSGFLAIIRLQNGLLTNNNRKLIYKSGLKANALLITQDMRLLQRLYYGFVKSSSLNN